MRALIIANGHVEKDEIIKEEYNKADLVICVDGGARYAVRAKITPNIIIGDLDSIHKDILNEMKMKDIEFIKFPTKKDMTDTELAIEYAVDKGTTEIVLLGVTGTRLDHTLANIMLLIKLLNNNIEGKIVDDHNEIFITKDSLDIEKEENTFLSIIPLIQNLSGVTLEGFEYETREREFKLSSTLGISNVITKDRGHIKIDSGIALVIKSRD